jgi:hypothetical protein
MPYEWLQIHRQKPSIPSTNMNTLKLLNDVITPDDNRLDNHIFMLDDTYIVHLHGTTFNYKEGKEELYIKSTWTNVHDKDDVMVGGDVLHRLQRVHQDRITEITKQHVDLLLL